MGINRLNRHGVHIKDVSDHLKTWPKYMPDDITHKYVKFLEEGRKHAMDSDPMLKFLETVISKDVSYAGSYVAWHIRSEKLLSEEKIDELLFNLGRSAFGDQKGHWKRCMAAYKSLKKEKAKPKRKKKIKSDTRTKKRSKN
jgi:hypothetical protein